MADDDDDDEAGDDGPSEDEVRAALRAVKNGEASLRDVITLVVAADVWAHQFVPQEATDAVFAKWSMDRDLANGGMDQVAWNHGHEQARVYANALRAVGAVENADLLDRLAIAVEAYQAEHGDQVANDPVKHFLAYRKSVDGPEFGIPEPGNELAEPLVEFVIERADTVPAPDIMLFKK